MDCYMAASGAGNKFFVSRLARADTLESSLLSPSITYCTCANFPNFSPNMDGDGAEIFLFLGPVVPLSCCDKFVSMYLRFVFIAFHLLYRVCVKFFLTKLGSHLVSCDVVGFQTTERNERTGKSTVVYTRRVEKGPAAERAACLDAVVSRREFRCYLPVVYWWKHDQISNVPVELSFYVLVRSFVRRLRIREWVELRLYLPISSSREVKRRVDDDASGSKSEEPRAPLIRGSFRRLALRPVSIAHFYLPSCFSFNTTVLWFCEAKAGTCSDFENAHYIHALTFWLACARFVQLSLCIRLISSAAANYWLARHSEAHSTISYRNGLGRLNILFPKVESAPFISRFDIRRFTLALRKPEVGGGGWLAGWLADGWPQVSPNGNGCQSRFSKTALFLSWMMDRLEEGLKEKVSVTVRIYFPLMARFPLAYLLWSAMVDEGTRLTSGSRISTNGKVHTWERRAKGE